MGKGILKFDPPNKTKKHDRQSSWKKTAMIHINDDVCEYYRWIISKRYPYIQGVKGENNWINLPLRGSHVTIINDRIEDINIWNKMKEKYDNTEMFFFYNWDGLRNNGEHIYFKVECPMGQEVRNFGNLGEPYFPYHMTIGLVPEESKIKTEHNLKVQDYMINR